MSLRSSSHVWRFVAALAPFPVVALGYFAAQPGSHLAFQLEVMLSGAGSAHARPAITQQQALEQPGPLGPQANRLFSHRGKGPRADLFSEAELAVKNHHLQPVAAAFAPVGDLTSSLGGGDSPFAMARAGKGDRASLPMTDVMRMSQPEMRDVAAAMFMVAPVGVSGDAYVGNGNAAEQGMLKNAAWKPSKEDFITYQGETEAEFQERERRCLAIAIYFEARGEPIEGQQAVAQVVMNRVRSPLYPGTICGVVYQGDHRKTGCQFSFTCDRKTDTPRDMTLWQQAQDIARDVTQGKVWLEDIGHSSHYHATYVNPVWKRHMNKTQQIGRHIFYRLKKEDPYIVQEIANETADQGDDEMAETKTDERVAATENVANASSAAESVGVKAANFFSFSNVFGGGDSNQAPMLGYTSN